MKRGAALLLLATLVKVANAQTPAPAVPAAVKVEVNGPHVHANDVIHGAPDVDLGPTPPIGASRIIDKSEIEKAFASAKVPAPKKIPAAVRVTRRTKRLSAADVSSAISSAIGEMRLPRGATLGSIRSVGVEVAGDFKKVNVDFPPMPRRSGSTTVSTTVTFLGEGGAPIHKTIVPIEILLPPEAAFADIQRGSAITLTVKRGLVEVSIPGVAAADADIGSTLPVTIKPSGRQIRARAVDKDHAIAEES